MLLKFESVPVAYSMIQRFDKLRCNFDRSYDKLPEAQSLRRLRFRTELAPLSTFEIEVSAVGAAPIHIRIPVGRGMRARVCTVIGALTFALALPLTFTFPFTALPTSTPPRCANRFSPSPSLFLCLYPSLSGGY